MPESEPRGIVEVSVAEDGISVGWVGETGEERVTETQELLAAIARVIGSRRPAGFFLRGMPRRFSESRALAVVLNTLRFAWRVPVVHDVSGRVHTALSIQELLDQATIPLVPRYSGEPNITKPRQ